MTKQELLRNVCSRIREKTGHEPKGSGEWLNAHCPAHEDSTPPGSLGVKAGDTCIVFKCHAGCGFDAITAALGMKPEELSYDYYVDRRPKKAAKKSFPPITVDELAADKGLPPALLRELGLAEISEGHYAGAVTIPYRLRDGSPAPRQRVRRALSAKDGSRWTGTSADGGLVPYGLWRLVDLPDMHGYLSIVEGESDCWTLWHHGFLALGIPGASNERCLELEHLGGCTDIVIVQEADKSGRDFTGRIRRRLEKVGWQGTLKVVEMSKDAKDPNALFKANPDDFKGAWSDRLLAAKPVDELVDQGADSADSAEKPSTGRRRRRNGPEPDEVADRFLEGFLPPSPAPPDAPPGDPRRRPGIVYYRDQFYRWTGQAYVLWPDGELRADLVRFIRDEGIGEPATRFVANVILNLMGIGRVSYALEPPFWISKQRPAGDHIVLANGILPIDRFFASGLDAKTLIDHTPDLFTLNALEYAFNPKAQCAKWSKFLCEVVPDGDNRALLSEWFGYCLLPTQRYQRILLLQGAGANGKSVVMAILRELVGAHNCSAQNVDSLHEQFALEPLVGKLVNFSNEFGRIEPAGENRLKQITGGDAVTINPKGREQYQARLHCRFVISSNNPPRINDRSDGMWRRLIMLPFQVRIAPEQQVPFDELVRGLCEELPGVLVWALTGLATLRARGYFAENKATEDAKRQYKLDSNPARAFLEEQLECDGNGHWISVQDVYEKYLGYCKENGHRYPLALPQFGGEVLAWRREVEPSVPDATLTPKRRRTTDGASFFSAYNGLTWKRPLPPLCAGQ